MKRTKKTASQKELDKIAKILNEKVWQINDNDRINNRPLTFPSLYKKMATSKKAVANNNLANKVQKTVEVNAKYEAHTAHDEAVAEYFQIYDGVPSHKRESLDDYIQANYPELVDILNF